jgi:hypothetical protein
MRIKKRAAGVVAAVVVVGGLVASTWVGAAGNSDPTSASATTDGIGETLLLVVGGVVAPSEALARLEAINGRYGEFQGLYADSTNAYEAIGALLQTSPDLVATPCLLAGLLDGDCVLGDVIKTVAPVTTQLVDIAALGRTETKALCALSGDACGLPQLQRLLGGDLELDPDATILATGFRTKRGAQDFIESSRAAGITGLVILQVRKLAGGDIGLGQEPAPDGSGPLTGPLADQESYQR